MALVLPILQLLNSLAGKGSTEEVQRMSEACNELAGRAQMAVDRHPPNEKADLSTALLENYETTQPLTVNGYPSDVYGGQNNLEERNSAILVR
jgi:hypothetical protein